jgi:formamidopyrimidine-DNA glycosylase
MPELPEVETVRRGLARLIIGKRIAAVRVFDSPKSFPNDQATVDAFMVGATVVDVHRRAKVLLIDLSSQYTLVIHLKMTGQLVVIPPATNSQSQVPRWGAGHPNDSLVGELPDRSTRVEISFSDDSRLFFNDQRKFGWIKLYPVAEVPNIDFMQRVGPEPLEDSFTSNQFIPRVRRRQNTTIKAAILDQTVLAGVGNIYADESLWGARIHPATRVRDVTDEQLTTLLAEIKYVMNLSIEKGGSTNHTYVNAEGKKGSYTDFARVFRREGQACPRCGSLIEKTRVAGRGTHICPVCQVLQ